MTRKQAEKIAREIVELIRKATPAGEHRTWTQMSATLPARIVEAIHTDPHLIAGCLPMGWRFMLRGHDTITITRAI